MNAALKKIQFPSCHIDPNVVDNAWIESLFDKLRVAVIFGASKEDEGTVLYKTANVRHWKSYESVAEDIAASLRKIGFRHVQTMPEGMDLPERLRRENIHMAWLNSGGTQGLSPVSHAPAMLEMMGVPYVGHNPLNAALLDDKGAFKLGLAGAGLPTAPFVIWDSSKGTLQPRQSPEFIRAFGDYAGPFIVKPVNGRASQNVEFISNVADIEEAVAAVHAKTGCMTLVEGFLSGREYCIAICGGTLVRAGQIIPGDVPVPFSPVERMLAAGETVFTSMDKLPITRDRVRPMDPATEKAEVEQLNALARGVYNTFKLETLVRLDIRADADGKMYILEANPKPDLARPSDRKTSIVCVGLPHLGMDYEDLILSLLADKLSQLNKNRPSAIRHILDML